MSRKGDFLISFKIVERGLGDTVGEGEGGRNRESSIDVRISPLTKQTASGHHCATQRAQPGDDLEG